MKIELSIAELKIIHACLIVAKNNAIENLNDKALSTHAIKNLDLINPLSYEIYSHIKENQRT
jgi:hypothetical protein